ncbi:MAG: orotidine 5'-phosphate decarboxylase [Planctomycetota bacterium]|jgi:3-hexulose-6-phosphate synthase/6-phospho-3-hexuloisomerase|nr:orotidine 5'-phosphate decarboxylase [Planctomycetota bacterium]
MTVKPRGTDGPFPVLQVALDFLDLERALKLAGEAVAGGTDWLEAGTPLLKSEGLEAVRRLCAAFPEHTVVADLKTMDAGRLEFEAAAKAGAKVAVVLAAAADSTIAECVEAGRKYGIKTCCDTINIPPEQQAERARQVEKLGVDFIGVHLPIDEQMLGHDPLARLKAVRAAVDTPLAVAGGVTSETAPAMVAAGAAVVIVGGALHKAKDARQAARALRDAMDSGQASASSLGHRASGAALAETLLRASTSNLSDAMHHRPCLRNIASRAPGLKMAGEAITVRSAPGDWSKVVQAIDHARPGNVLVADCGGVPPAVFGELAALSAKGRGLAGVVIHGYIRDSDVSTRLGLPLFATGVCSDAGEANGFGEINCEINLSGQAIRPGDWIFADDDGVMVLPREGALSWANRAVDVAENEERVAEEIRTGKTLGEVFNLKRWDRH